MHAWILELQGKIRKLIPKGCSACNNILHAWELACEFHVVINERPKVQFLKSFWVCLAVHVHQIFQSFKSLYIVLHTLT